MSFLSKIKNYFQFDEKKAVWKKEIIGGISTFIAMSYILSVNPAFLSLTNWIGTTQPIGVHAGGFNHFSGALFLGVAIGSFLATFFMGVFAKIPLSQAPGMGINVFFTFTVANQFKLGFQGALFVVMISGLLYFIIALTPLRQKMLNSLNANFKIAIGTMIGIFIGYVGLSSMGVIQQNVWGAPTQIGLHLNNPIILTGIAVLFVLLMLHFLKVPFPVLISTVFGIFVLGMLAAGGQGEAKEVFKLNKYSDFAAFGELHKSVWTADVLQKTFSNPLTYVAAFTFLFVNFFDAAGTMFIVGKSLGLTNDDETMKKFSFNNWLTRANIVEASSTLFAPFMLNSSIVSYVESNTAIAMGAKTGISAIITSFFFLLAIVLWPILNPIFPVAINTGSKFPTMVQPITGPILVLIGIFMLSELKHFDWKESYDIPVLAFIVLFGVLGFSITAGISWGVLLFVLLNAFAGVKEYVQIMMVNRKQGVKTKFKETAIQTRLKVLNIPLIVMFIISLSYIILTMLISAGIIK